MRMSMIGAFAGIGYDSSWSVGILGNERLSKLFDIVMFIVSCCDSISTTFPEDFPGFCHRFVSLELDLSGALFVLGNESLRLRRITGIIPA